MKDTAGFTLIELLVVIAVISLLATLALSSIDRARQRAYAARITADFRSIQTAWRSWQADTDSDFVIEGVYGTVNKAAPCHIEPALSDTDLFNNVSGKSGWRGPYMSFIPKDPWGREYSYHNNMDTWSNTSAGKWGGVNVQLQWCTQDDATRYLQLAPLIDAIIDGSDGGNLGRFRWDNTYTGSYGFLMALSYRG